MLSVKDLQINPEKVVKKAVVFIRNRLEKAGRKGLVVGLSGGLDSSTAAALCVEAVGNNRVLGVVLPEEDTPEKDVADAEAVADQLGVRCEKINITPILEAYARWVPAFNAESLVSVGNLKARVRMSILYYYANMKQYLVVGTGNFSEYVLGYFTLYGDGAYDMAPIRNLYKTQVRQIASYLGIPENIVKKAPSARLWPGQTDEEELGAPYETIDLVLEGLQRNMASETIAKAIEIDVDLVDRIKEKIEKTKFKRIPPPALEM